MSLDHAILGFLNYKPLSGYDLKSSFDMSVRHFWPADQSQIYRTLSKLTEHGYAEVEVVEQDDRPDRKVYHITDAGREKLHDWLTSDLPHGGERIAALIQIFFAGGLSDEEIVVMLRRLADSKRRQLEGLRGLPKARDVEKDDSYKRDSYFWGLTLEYGIHMVGTSLTWIEDVIARIERGEHTSCGKGEKR